MQLSPSKVSSRQIPSTTLQDVGGGVTVGGNDVEVGAGCEVVQAEISINPNNKNNDFFIVFLSKKITRPRLKSGKGTCGMKTLRCMGHLVQITVIWG